MIQALLKNLTPAIDAQKSAPSVEGELNLESQLAEIDFASELDSQLFTSPDILTAQAIDPDMTQKVDAIIAPEVEQALDANLLPEKKTEIDSKNLELPQAVKTENLKNIQATNKEIPQILSGEDFVQQKIILPKKNISVSPYGMTQNPKLAQELNLSAEQVVQSVESKQSPMNSQQFLLQMMGEQGNSVTLEAAKVDAPVFQMGEIKSSQPQQILNQISDYIVQAKIAKEPTINLKVNHQELGMIDITVQRVAQNEAVAINIATQSSEGSQFFQQNSKDLLTHLTTAGVNVSDLKLETSSSSGSRDFDFNQHQQKQAQSEKQFGSEQNQKREDAQRREDLWKQFSREAA